MSIKHIKSHYECIFITLFFGSKYAFLVKSIWINNFSDFWITILDTRHVSSEKIGHLVIQTVDLRLIISKNYQILGENVIFHGHAEFCGDLKIHIIKRLRPSQKFWCIILVDSWGLFLSSTIKNLIVKHTKTPQNYHYHNLLIILTWYTVEWSQMNTLIYIWLS